MHVCSFCMRFNISSMLMLYVDDGEDDVDDDNNGGEIHIYIYIYVYIYILMRGGDGIQTSNRNI